MKTREWGEMLLTGRKPGGVLLVVVNRRLDKRVFLGRPPDQGATSAVQEEKDEEGEEEEYEGEEEEEDQGRVHHRLAVQ